LSAFNLLLLPNASKSSKANSFESFIPFQNKNLKNQFPRLHTNMTTKSSVLLLPFLSINIEIQVEKKINNLDSVRALKAS
jgi:hypothetical protein